MALHRLLGFTTAVPDPEGLAAFYGELGLDGSPTTGFTGSDGGSAVSSTKATSAGSSASSSAVKDPRTSKRSRVGSPMAVPRPWSRTARSGSTTRRAVSSSWCGWPNPPPPPPPLRQSCRTPPA